ncbi:hypothetical protein TIFTF001_008419 [Ficus carica]|uniref:Uncharacterized protein n=1 Tax=Ficus carica TaxID=3494 RepID=A0AA87ZT83_FICCA|nr:hypothetical protein TIFTF001_008419 [Ficus carica]
MKVTTTNPKPHAIIVALHLQGHVIPTVHLATKLASKGFTITFVNIEATHHEITKSKQHNVGSHCDATRTRCAKIKFMPN